MQVRGGCGASTFRTVTTSVPVTRATDALRYRVAGRQHETDEAVKERVKHKKQVPAEYKVVLLNDDYTPMDFVVHLVETLFQKPPAEAYRIMMQVHLNGRGVAGVYPWEVAETKVEMVTAMARDAQHPLRATLEEA